MKWLKQLGMLLVPALMVLPLQAQYSLSGNAFDLGGGCVRLTQALNSQLGGGYHPDSIDLTQPFDFRFEVYLGTNNNGADGICFVMKSNLNPMTGQGGGGIGFQNLTNAVGIEFDTYQNGNFGDPTFDHIGIISAGSTDHTQPSSLAGPIQASPTTLNIEDGLDHPVRVTWDPATTELKVWFDCVLRLTYTGDIVATQFGGNPIVWWGFVGSTGGLNNEQRFCEIGLNGFQNSPLSDTTICFGDTATVNAGPSNLNYLWSPTTNLSSSTVENPDLYPTSTTTYHVTVSDQCDSIFDSVLITVNPQPQWTGAISGPDSLCEGDTAIYTIPAEAFAVNYTWTVPTGSIIHAGQGTNTVTVVADSASGMICVSYEDTCSFSPDTCFFVEMNAAPSTAFAGNDTSICSTTMILNGTPATIGTGLWSFVSGSGTVAAPTVATSQVSNLQSGPNVLQYTISSGVCAPSTDQVTITAVDPPTVDFSFTDVCAGEFQQFNNLVVANTNPIAQYEWDVDNDGIVDYTTPDPFHSYSIHGTQGVTLTVEDNTGCSSSASHNVQVHPLPQPAFSGASACMGTPGQFTNNSSIATGTITSTVWDFGDGSGSALSSPSHLFPSEGSYQVELFLTSDQGCMDSLVSTFQVFHVPVADFSVAQNCSNEPAEFTDNSTIVSGFLTQWDWDFGDGFSDVAQNPLHQYANEILHTATLTVTSNDGCSATTSVSFEQLPSPKPDFLTEVLCEEELFTFTNATTIKSPGVISSWDWDFGDVSVSTDEDPEKSYSTAGDYTVTLTATSADNCVATVDKPMIIRPLPTADFSFVPGCEQTTISFQSTSFVSDGRIDEYSWDFGDGVSGIAGIAPDHIFADGGTYQVSLFLETNFGCTAVVSEPVTIFHLPDVSFTVSPTEGCSPLEVVFENTSSVGGNSTLLQGLWDFGNGLTGTASTASTTYDHRGDFPVKYSPSLTVTSSDGCTSSFQSDTGITANPRPKASFNVSDSMLLLFDPIVRFEDLSTGGLIWSWDFGDGETEQMEKLVQHEYSDIGTYTASLRVENQYFCVDVATQRIVVDHEITIYIPSAFTPDGDFLNDVYYVRGGGFEGFELTIYTRWGEAVFNTTDIDQGWDGTLDNGKLAPVGNYVYRVAVKDRFDAVTLHHGTLKLMR